MKSHKLVAQKVVCYRNVHKSPQHMKLTGAKWWCTKNCNGRYGALGPLVPGRAHRTTKQMLKYVILYVRGGRHADAEAEAEVSNRTVVSLRQWMDSLMPTAHLRRRIRNRSSITRMQCDKTFYSIRKRHRGRHGARRVQSAKKPFECFGSFFLLYRAID